VTIIEIVLYAFADLLDTSVCGFSAEMKKEEEDDEVSGQVKKRVPLSLEELLAKKKAEEEAQSKVH